jgi:PAS domain S-box-containing protein
MRKQKANHSNENNESVSQLEAEVILTGLASVFASSESAIHQLDSETINQRMRATLTEESSPHLEAKYWALLEQIPAIVFMAFLDRGISEAYINPQIEPMLGFSQKEWLNDPVRWYRQIHPDDKARWNIEAARLLLLGEPLQSVYRVMARDGHVVWFRCEAKMVRHEDGRPWFVHGVAFDISQLKQSEEALRKAHDELEVRVQQRTAELARANAELQAEIAERKIIQEQLEEEWEIIETVNRTGRMLAAELDLDKLMQSITDAATELSGAQFGAFFYNVQNEHGGSYMLFTLSGAQREHYAHLPLPRVTEIFGPTFHGEGVVRIDDVKKDSRYGKNSPFFGMPPGHLPVTSYLAIPVISRSGSVLGGLLLGHSEAGIFSERSEQIAVGLAAQAAVAIDNARLYAAERKARAEAETVNRLKDEFLATVSHELRAPLHAILGWARLLSTGMMDEETTKRGLEIIENNAKGQQRIIDDILDVSRIITGKLRIDMAYVDISSVIEAAVDSMRLAAEAKGVNLQISLDPSVDMVLGDANRLQQVIWNLISNAIRFTPQGGRVQVLSKHADSQVEIEVIDTGIGIKPEFLVHVFDRFRQEDSSTTRIHGGLGLGLAIVRHLVELHGGTVTADNRIDEKGAIFTVRLPLSAVSKNRNYHAPKHLGQNGKKNGNRETESNLANLRVLLVDDEADGREMIATMLEQDGAQVKGVASVNEALQLLAEWNPDVLISDIGMPIEDGYSLIRKVRTLPPERGGTVPAIALTGFARNEDQLKALSAGYQSHISKPVVLQDLIAAVASLAGRYV